MRKTPSVKLFAASHNVLRPGQLPRPVLGLYPCPINPVPHRSLAQIRSDDQVFPEIWFTSSRPPVLAKIEGGPSAKDYAPPDERTLKLGESKCGQDHARRIVTGRTDRLQHSKHFRIVFLVFLPHRYPQRYSRHTSPFIYFPLRILTCQLSPVGWRIMLPCGRHP